MELSLAIVFFTNIVLSLGALIYIVTGINTDLFTWARDYIISLKDEDSAVNAKVRLLAHPAAAGCAWLFSECKTRWWCYVTMPLPVLSSCNAISMLPSMSVCP